MFGNNKAIKWVEGRKNWQQKLDNLASKNEEIIWIHAASLGEYIQAKPLISDLKSNPETKSHRIIVSFFSPSGYEYINENDQIDGITYLPVDTKKNARIFLDILKPKIAIFVKYDFWFNFLSELQKRNIPTLYFSCNFRKEQFYFKKSSDWQRSIMKKIDIIQTLNQSSVDLLSEYDFTNAKVGGDTRFDQVITNSENSQPIELIAQFKQSDLTLILGSSWPEEENLLSHYLEQPDNLLKIIIAPHDISERHLTQIEARIPNTIRYSRLNNNNLNQSRIVIIDNIGMLSNLYQYGDIALIGGGFNNALHNTLEAAIFDNLILFGNNHSKYPEAQQLIDFGGGIEIANKEEFTSTLNRVISAPEDLKKHQKKAKEFIVSNSGASNKVMTDVIRLLK